MSAAADEQTPERSSNRVRALVASLVALEAVLLALAAIVFLVASVASARDSRAALIALAALAAALAAGLAVSARGVARGLRWTRGPVVTWQLVQAGVGLPLSTSQDWWAGVPLLGIAVVIVVLVLRRHVIAQPLERF